MLHIIALTWLFFTISPTSCMENNNETPDTLIQVASTVSELEQKQKDAPHFCTPRKALEALGLGAMSTGLFMAGLYLGTQCTSEQEQEILSLKECRALAGGFGISGVLGLVGTLLRILHRE